MSEKWYCVRCIFEWGPSFDVKGLTSYEERLVLIQAESDEDAIHKAESEAEEYASKAKPYADGVSYIGYAQAYRLVEEEVEKGFGNGTEVFS